MKLSFTAFLLATGLVSRVDGFVVSKPLTGAQRTSSISLGATVANGAVQPSERGIVSDTKDIIHHKPGRTAPREIVLVNEPRNAIFKEEEEEEAPPAEESNEPYDPFFFASDDEEDDDTPGWRLDPEVSFSDWTFELSNGEQYHVHKFFLGAGPRRGSRFKGLMKASKGTTTSLDLKKSAAAALPAFLDYVYGGDLVISTESALALRHLSEYFGVGCLLEKVNAFIDEDLSSENVGIYAQEAAEYNFPDMIKHAMVVTSTIKESLMSDEPSQAKIVMGLLTLEQQKEVLFDALKSTIDEGKKKDEMIAKQEEAITNLHKELGNFKRAPSTWGATFFEPCTSNSMKQPSTMPLVGNYNKDGYVVPFIDDQTMAVKKICPVFYYDGKELD